MVGIEEVPGAKNDITHPHKLSGHNYDDFGVCTVLAVDFHYDFYHLLQFAYHLLQKIAVNDTKIF